MRGSILVAVYSAAALLFPTLAWVQEQPKLTSVTVELPAGDALFPGGTTADAINNNCIACHSADMVLDQPTLPRATWEAEVLKMINVYKAPIADSDVAAIVDYLAKLKGTN